MPLVYKITNSITQKVYIGWTGSTLEHRWNTHLKAAKRGKDNRKFYNAIRKYGDECWMKEIIVEVNDKNIAKEREIEFIELYDSYNNGYNSTKGGDGNNGIIMSAESNLARSLALKGRSKSSETVAKFRSRRQTSETKNAISQSHKGMKKPWVKWDKERIIKRATTRRSITKDQHEKIIQLHEIGMINREISEVLGIEYDIVKKWVKRVWDL